MFNIFKPSQDKIIKKAVLEYNSIIKLEEKRKKLVAEYSDIPDDIAATQRDMLINNIKDIAFIIDERGGLENNTKDINDGYYFNIQGTKPAVLRDDTSMHYYESEFMDKKGKNKIFLTFINTSIPSHRIEEILGLEEKFIELSSNDISYKAKGRLTALAEKKINKKITEFCGLFKGNEQLLKEYIFSGFSGLSGEDNHYHNINTMKKRLNFTGLIYPYIKDSEYMEVGPKELIYIRANRLGDSINTLLNGLKNKQHDFIIGDKG